MAKLNFCSVAETIFIFAIIANQAYGDALPTLESIQSTAQTPTKILATGKRETIEPLVNGKIHGLAKYYHPNGQLYGVIEYSYGKKIGKHILYREDGTKEQELSYEDNRPNGLCRWFDAKGEVYLDVTYNKGAVISKKDYRSPMKQNQPKSASPLNQEIEKAFTPEKSLDELIEIALRKVGSDLVSTNVKARAYSLLKQKAEDREKMMILKKQEIRFLEDWKSTKSDWTRSKIAEFILKLDPPKIEKSDLILSAISEFWLSPYPNERKQEEERVIQLLSGLSDAQDPVVVLTKLLQLMRVKLSLSVRLIDAALVVIDKWMPVLPQRSIDEVVNSRFEFTSMIEGQKNQRNNSSGMMTVWNYASDSEIKSTLAHFDKTVCSRSISPKVKTWQYDYLTKGLSETKFQDQHQRLVCSL